MRVRRVNRRLTLRHPTVGRRFTSTNSQCDATCKQGQWGGARETPQPARSEVPKSLFEAVEESVGALLGHAVHVV